MRTVRLPIITAGLLTVTVCLALLFLPRLGQAGGEVTNCADQADLVSKLAGGGLVTFNCGGTGAPATIAISPTLVITANTTIDGGGKIHQAGYHAAHGHRRGRRRKPFRFSCRETLTYDESARGRRRLVGTRAARFFSRLRLGQSQQRGGQPATGLYTAAGQRRCTRVTGADRRDSRRWVTNG